MQGSGFNEPVADIAFATTCTYEEDLLNLRSTNDGLKRPREQLLASSAPFAVTEYLNHTTTKPYALCGR